MPQVRPAHLPPDGMHHGRWPVCRPARGQAVLDSAQPPAARPLGPWFGAGHDSQHLIKPHRLLDAWAGALGPAGRPEQVRGAQAHTARHTLHADDAPSRLQGHAVGLSGRLQTAWVGGDMAECLLMAAVCRGRDRVPEATWVPRGYLGPQRPPVQQHPPISQRQMTHSTSDPRSLLDCTWCIASAVMPGPASCARPASPSSRWQSAHTRVHGLPGLPASPCQAYPAAHQPSHDLHNKENQEFSWLTKSRGLRVARCAPSVAMPSKAIQKLPRSPPRCPSRLRVPATPAADGYAARHAPANISRIFAIKTVGASKMRSP